MITQDRINAFADATGDHQWIHVDTERARAETPFGATIAHGFLTLSLLSALMRDAVTVDGPRMTLNYGLNRVRFVSPVPSGSRIRARIALAGIDDMGDSIQATWSVTIEREGGDKPALVAEWIVRYYGPPDTKPVRAGEELDWTRLEAWLRDRLPASSIPAHDLRERMQVAQFPGGHSNLTYQVRFGGTELVIRRPPFGPVAPTAHDMARETGGWRRSIPSFRWLPASTPSARIPRSSARCST